MFQRVKFGAGMGGHHLSEESVCIGIVDANGQDFAGLTTITCENNNPVARSSTGQLQDIPLHTFFGAGFAGAFDQYLHRLTEKILVILLANGIL